MPMFRLIKRKNMVNQISQMNYAKVKMGIYFQTEEVPSWCFCDNVNYVPFLYSDKYKYELGDTIYL